MASQHPEFNPSNVSVFRQSNPSNILNGAKKGVGNLAYGILGALGVVMIMPFAGARSGYESYGIVGAFGGTLVGAAGGVLGAIGVLISGLFSFLYFTTLGLIRTPTAVYSLALGKQWDKDAEEWIDYDMSVETDLLLGITEEQFIEHVNEKKSATQIYSPTHRAAKIKREGGGNTANASGAGGESKPVIKKKIVQDRALYDILGVEPEATSAEIKKAYYIQAKKNHPDRNPDDAQAKANFQRISQAYQILGDDALRLAYDSRGQSAVEGNKGMEASTMYTMIFGSENFETIIGELGIVSQIKLAMESTKPTEILRFRQRVRELKCAIILAGKLDAFLDGDEEVFREKAQNEAKELSESALGGTLLGLIGSIYVERASAYLSTLSAAYMYTGKTFAGISNAFSFLGWSFSAAWSGMEVRSLKMDAARRQAEMDKRDGVTEEQRKARKAAAGPVDMAALYGPNPTPEHKAKVHAKAKQFGSNLLGLLWQTTRSDVEETLKHVCKKVLLDKSVSAETRRRRAEALLLLGEQYVLRRVQDMDGIADFLERIGRQTGVFSDHPDFSAFAGTPAEERQGNFAAPGDAFFSDALGKDALLEIQSRLESLSVKELKETIAALGGDASHCIEKEDLRKYLRELLLIRLSAMDDRTGQEEHKN